MKPTKDTAPTRTRPEKDPAPAVPRATTEVPGSWTIAVGGACALIGVILFADSLEGPKTAYVGVLTAVPLFAAIFGTALQTAVAAVITWTSAFTFGQLASDGNVTAQKVRLGIIAGAGILAIVAAQWRAAREGALVRAQIAAAEAATFRDHANHDELTGLLNRRGLLDALPARPEAPLTLVLTDCDRFKTINDTHGHAIGDEVLRAIAGRLRANLAAEDLVARWGGDEFLLVLRVPKVTGITAVSRLQGIVNGTPVTTQAGPLPVSMSMGVAEWDGSETFDVALANADRELYEAKSRRHSA